jgi:hypothetical protein
MDPEMDDLRALIESEANASDEKASGLAKFAARTSPEGRALELAIAAIEALRERGSVTGAQVCKLAALMGYDDAAIARAWNTRTEFDLKKTSYGFDAPIARVLPLP